MTNVDSLQNQNDLLTGRNATLSDENAKLRLQRDDLIEQVARDQVVIQAYINEIAAREAQANDDSPSTRANLVTAVARRRHAVAEQEAAK